MKVDRLLNIFCNSDCYEVEFYNIILLEIRQVFVSMQVNG